MKITALALAAVATTLAGCASSPAHQCKLKEGGIAKCASMDDAYSASMSKLGNKQPSRQESIFGTNAVGEDGKPMQVSANTSNAQPFFTGQATAYPDPGQQGTPVFKQPRVHRVWIAPYVDADGNLRSGEYAYFSTPGEWNYGNMKKSGSASAASTFGPAKPDNYGVNIVNTNRNIIGGVNAAPPVPATPAQTNRGPIQVPNAQGTIEQSNTAVPVDGITQPVQRFN